MKSIYRRVKSKTTRDFFVYFKRKLYLYKVKKNHLKYGEEYYFSAEYLKKHLESGLDDTVIAAFMKETQGLFGDIAELNSRLLVMKKHDPDTIKKIVDYSDDVISHKFDLLGSGLVNLNYPARPTGNLGKVYEWKRFRKPVLFSEEYNPIDWHIDFKSGYRWDPLAYYTESRNYVEAIGADIKVPWELSRCQHLPMLGISYQLTNESIYAEEIYMQICDWIHNNPLCKGPNWNCPMDVAIRVANWLVALELIRNYSDDNRRERKKIIIASLVQHMDYIWNNFEWSSKLTSNHYLSDISGFLFCLVYIPSVKRKKKFLKFIEKEFKCEIHKQFYYDGMNSEGSIPYHRLVLELFTYSFILAKKNGILFGEEYTRQLERSFMFTSSVMKPDGGMPQIGDNDSGIFLKFFPRELSSFLYLNSLRDFVVSVNSDILSNNETKEFNSIESAIFNYQESEVTTGDSLFKTFNESGVSILKDKDIYFSFYHGLNGQKGNGGHCHNDRLSFTLSFKGRDIFVDPGTGLYTALPNLRNKLRSTSSHNTVEIGRVEQNDFPADGYLFSVSEDITAVNIETKQKEDKYFFNASHNGYDKLNYDAKHIRNIEVALAARKIIIRDSFKSDVEKAAWFILRNHDGLFMSDEKIMSPLFTMSFSEYTEVSTEEYDYSASYGKVEEDGCLRVKVRFKNNLKTTILLHE